MLKAPDKLNEVLQGDFTDYTTEDGEKYRIGCITELFQICGTGQNQFLSRSVSCEGNVVPAASTNSDQS